MRIMDRLLRHVGANTEANNANADDEHDCDLVYIRDGRGRIVRQGGEVTGDGDADD